MRSLLQKTSRTSSKVEKPDEGRPAREGLQGVFFQQKICRSFFDVRHEVCLFCRRFSFYRRLTRGIFIIKDLREVYFPEKNCKGLSSQRRSEEVFLKKKTSSRSLHRRLKQKSCRKSSSQSKLQDIFFLENTQRRSPFHRRPVVGMLPIEGFQDDFFLQNVCRNVYRGTVRSLLPRENLQEVFFQKDLLSRKDLQEFSFIENRQEVFVTQKIYWTSPIY